jgi:DNA-binding NtrC family response regulator
MDPEASLHVAVWSQDSAVAAVADSRFDDWVVHEIGTVRELSSLTAEHRLDYILVDVDLLLGLAPSGDHRSCLKELHRISVGARVVVVAEPERLRDAVDCVRMGADDYLSRPVSADSLTHVRESIVRQERIRAEISYLRRHVWENETLSQIPSASGAMISTLFKVRQVAPTRSTVLLTGETGTGKSFLAGLLHRTSSRANRQLVQVHCGAIPESLLESELFGHERGAFTGADRRQLGRFEIADGGTLFLDEVGTISPAMQVKLLHVLQERSFRRVGGEREIQVDVRIVAATNVDLAALSDQGLFRKDLYYRLNVFPIEVPPLRERREDIPLLVDTLFERLCAAHEKDTVDLHPAVMDAFMSYDWPGNVRELENLLERALILETGSRLLPEDFPEELFRDQLLGRIPVDTEEGLGAIRQRAAEHAEMLYLREQLAAQGGRIEATARAAGVSPRHLHRLMKRHGLSKEDFRS